MTWKWTMHKMSRSRSLTAREVDIGAEQGQGGGFAAGGLWCCPVSRGEEEERCTVSFRLTSRRNAEVCLVSCVGVVGDEEIPEAVQTEKIRHIRYSLSTYLSIYLSGIQFDVATITETIHCTFKTLWLCTVLQCLTVSHSLPTKDDLDSPVT